MDFNRDQLGFVAVTILSVGFVVAAMRYRYSKAEPSSTRSQPLVHHHAPNLNARERHSARYDLDNTPAEQPPVVTLPEPARHIIGQWRFKSHTTTYNLRLEEVPNAVIYEKEMENERDFWALERRQPFTVNANLKSQFRSWENVHLLIRELDGFNKRAHVNDWCRNMSITLPTQGIDMGDADSACKSLKVFPDSLETLSWKGHRHQLPLFFKDNFQHLSRLSLRCELSAFDFVAILHMGRRTLESVEVRTIVDHHEPELQQMGGGTSYVMESLRSLTVVSKVDFHEVISLFKFRKLEEISIVNGSKTTFNLNFFARFDSNDLKRIKRLDAHCFVGEGERKWLETNISGVHVGDGPLRDRDFSIEN